MSAARTSETLRVVAGACLVHSRSGQRVETETTILPAAALDEAHLRLTIAAHRHLHGEGAALQWKVVGEAAVKVAAIFQSLGEKVEKAVERPGAFEAVHMPAEGRLRISREEAAPVAAAEPRRLKVLVVDDSGSIRGLLKKMVEADSDMMVVAAAARPSEVEALIVEHRPDVITLDIHMPEEDGVSLLRRLFPKYRIPTIMVTAISLQEGRKVFEALEIGAVDYVQKPEFSEIATLGVTLREKIRIASKATLKNFSAAPAESVPVADVAMDPSAVIVIGSSTGGTEALKTLLTGLPARIPPILIVQHIPPVFSRAFADRMNQLCPFEVLEGSEAGIELAPGRVIVAAGGTQMGVKKSGAGWRISVDPAADPVNRHKPSVDFLFQSALGLFAGPRVGVILTGMGADGAKGLKGLRDQGWTTIAQDEATSVVFGMPKEAIRMGGAEHVLPLPRISAKLTALLKK